MHSRSRRDIGLVTLLVILMAGVGCTNRTDAVDRELELLKAKFAALETVRVPRTVTPPEPAITVGSRPARLTRGRHLPVVKLRPIIKDPFAGGREPTIRIGSRGKTAPPVLRQARKPLQYAKLDRYGNLVDDNGQIVYRSGNKAKRGATPPAKYDPHESPARRADRLVRAPRIQYDRRIYRRPAMSPQELNRVMRGGNRYPGGAAHRSPQLKKVPLRYPKSGTIVYPKRRPVVRPSPVRPVARPVARPAPSKKRRAPAPVLRGKKKGKAVKAAGPTRMLRQRAYQGKKQRNAVALYNRARKTFLAGKFKVAASSFQDFLKRYYDHEFADNALYWLGETAYTQMRWRQALSLFQEVVIRYPEGNKLGDAMLKSALCYVKLGDSSYAIKVLNDVETLFPKQRVAGVARKIRLGLKGGGQ